MFERDRITENILVEMDKNIRRNAAKQKSEKLNRRSTALELLNKAAANFESLGLIHEAEAVTRVMQLAAVEKPPTVKKQIQNLKQYGMQLAPADIEVEEELDNAYDALMEDEKIAAEVVVGENGEEEIETPDAEALAKMWE